mmetsp:Transcript_16603/g.56623  ORF Transcript_16603/g.56623 Transcript_16603/m.56623 type:complete len:201 (-) Transcript_16603:619-1221(-)
MASVGGWSHLVASAAMVSRSALLTPSWNMAHSACISISFAVRVPVLSAHSAVMLARSSIAESLVTIVSQPASLRPASASMVVHTTRRAMGTEAMSSMMTNPRAWNTSSRLARRAANMATMHAALAQTILSVSRMIMRSNLDSLPAAWKSSAAVRPRYVPAPVAVTTAAASPLVTVEPISACSPALTVTGSDSPVSGAWST